MIQLDKIFISTISVLLNDLGDVHYIISGWEGNYCNCFKGFVGTNFHHFADLDTFINI